MPKKLTTEEFIDKARKVHGNKFDYSQVDYITAIKKVKIICPIHGPFQQKPYKHLTGQSCYSCGVLRRSKLNRDNQDSFLEKARKIHGSKYDYSQVIYTQSKKKIKIGCDIHGWFYQIPNSHLSGRGCKKCAISMRAELKNKDLDVFIKDARKIHGDKYDYLATKYKNTDTKIKILCPVHGVFEQLPSSHLQGRGCNECGLNEGTKKRTKNRDEFISDAKEIHGDKYDYSKVVYKQNKSKIIIGCPKHGWFEQKPNSHLTGRGCLKCKNKAEGRIAEYLEKKFIIHRSYSIKGNKMIYDFYLPDYNQIIERDGEQHYKDIDFGGKVGSSKLRSVNANDGKKTELAKKHGYKIARIPYWLNDEQVEREIDNILAGNPSYPDVPDLKQSETEPLPK